MKKRRRLRVKNRRRLLTGVGVIVLAVAVLAGLVILGVTLLSNQKNEVGIAALSFSASAKHVSTGTGVLELSNGTLAYHDFSDTKKDFSVAVSTEDVSIAGYGTNALVYNSVALQIVGGGDALEFTDPVQSVTCSPSYFAVYTESDAGEGTLRIYDYSGTESDEIPLSGSRMIDYGFSESDGARLYVYTLDTDGSDLSGTLTLYDVSKRSTVSMIPVLQQLPESVLCTANSVFYCGTDSLVRYQGNSEAYRVTVYGWELLDASSASSKPMFLYAPRTRSELVTAEVVTLAEEDLSGESRVKLQLPEGSFAAFLSNGKVISFAPGGVTKTTTAGKSETTAFEFSADSAEKLAEGRFLVTSGENLYLVTP